MSPFEAQTVPTHYWLVVEGQVSITIGSQAGLQPAEESSEGCNRACPNSLSLGLVPAGVRRQSPFECGRLRQRLERGKLSPSENGNNDEIIGLMAQKGG